MSEQDKVTGEHKDATPLDYVRWAIEEVEENKEAMKPKKQKDIVEKIVLHRHVTTGGAVYLTDNHMFGEAKIVIRLDGKPELSVCKLGCK
jgi:hypothetical protein